LEIELMPPRGKYQIKLNAVMFTMLLEELMAGPAKAQDIADYTGMSVLTVQRTLRVMHRRGVIHVAGYEIDQRGAWTLRLFALGQGKDKKKPSPNSSGGRCAARARDREIHAALAG
jgi:hypothetical protein